MRHAFYIEGHGWSGLASRDGRESAEFDDDHAVYLMSIDPFGDVAASVRLNPTTQPTLLENSLVGQTKKLPELESVWDISRWIAAPQHRRAANPRWPSNHQRELMVGILEFCLSRGHTHLTMLAEIDLAGPVLSRVSGSEDLRDIAAAISPAQLRALARALSQDLAGDDWPRAIELVGLINRLIEAAGLSLESEEADPENSGTLIANRHSPQTETARSFDRAAPSVRND